MKNEPQKGIMKNCKNSAHNIYGNENEECSLCSDDMQNESTNQLLKSERLVSNEPQLSAEIEKRLEKFLTDTWGWSYEYGEWLDSESQPIGGIKDLKHFLATALEEQREKVLEEIEKWVEEANNNGKMTDFELRTKLNQMKGEE